MRWLRFENALRNVLGSKSGIRGLAGLFEGRKSERKAAIKRWIKKMKQPCIEITYLDPRLREMTLSDLESLEKDLKLIGKDAEAEWDLITDLLMLSSRLVGYDWLDGEVHRQVVYQQNQEQEWNDLKNKQPIKPYKPLAEEEKELDKLGQIEKKIVADLLERGLTFFEIYGILRMPPVRLERIIKECRQKK